MRKPFQNMLARNEKRTDNQKVVDANGAKLQHRFCG
jgi:hypothetical protein